MKERELSTNEPILHLVDQFMSASIQKDTTFMSAYLHPNFLFVTPRGTVFNYDTFFSDFLLNAKFSLVTFERIEQQVFLAPGLGLLNGIVKARFQGGEERFERISFLWVPSPANWSLLQVHSTFTTKTV